MYSGKDEKFECKVDFKEYLDLNESYYNVKGVPKEKSTKYSLFCGTILMDLKDMDIQLHFVSILIINIIYLMKLLQGKHNEIQKQKIYLLIYKKK